MAIWDTLPIFIALPLALAAALMSGDVQARREISVYLTQAFTPQAADLNSDPGYLLGIANQTIWPLPDRAEPFNQ
jgi:hypothetical protein